MLFSGVKNSLLFLPIVVFSLTYSKGMCAGTCRRQVFPDPDDLMSDKIRKDFGLGGIGISVCCLTNYITFTCRLESWVISDEAIKGPWPQALWYWQCIDCEAGFSFYGKSCWWRRTRWSCDGHCISRCKSFRTALASSALAFWWPNPGLRSSWPHVSGHVGSQTALADAFGKSADFRCWKPREVQTTD